MIGTDTIEDADAILSARIIGSGAKRAKRVRASKREVTAARIHGKSFPLSRKNFL
jgi:hypothetical protein